MTVDLSRPTAPLAEVEAEAERLWAERDRRVTALNFRAAAARTHSPSDRIAFLLDAVLVRNQVRVSVDDDYPGFAEWVAAREADNRRARRTK